MSDDKKRNDDDARTGEEEVKSEKFTPIPKDIHISATPDTRYEDFRNQLVPLMATVMGARATGHPDLDRHLQALSDLIHNGIE